MLITSLACLALLAILFRNLRNHWYLLHMAVILGVSWHIDQNYFLAQFDTKTFLVFLVVHLASINLVIFLMYFKDKMAAKTEAWRIPEKVFHTYTFVGGGFGALLGQKIFNHKRAKKSFRDMFVAILIIQGMIFIVALYFLGKS